MKKTKRQQSDEAIAREAFRALGMLQHEATKRLGLLAVKKHVPDAEDFAMAKAAEKMAQVCACGYADDERRLAAGI